MSIVLLFVIFQYKSYLLCLFGGNIHLLKKKKIKCTTALAFIKAYSTFNTESTWWCSWKSTSIWHWRPVYMGTLSQLCGLTRTFNVHGLGRVGRVERILFKPYQECDRQPSQSFPGQRTMFRLQWERNPICIFEWEWKRTAVTSLAFIRWLLDALLSRSTSMIPEKSNAGCRYSIIYLFSGLKVTGQWCHYVMSFLSS